MYEFSIEAFQANWFRIAIALLGPPVAHILYAIFSKSRPVLALMLVSSITMIWMFFASTITYGPPFGAYAKSVITLYVLLATIFLWFAHHQLVRRSELKPVWLFHVPVIALFIAFGMLVYNFHIAPNIYPPV